MSDLRPDDNNGKQGRPRLSGKILTLASAFMVVALALGAVFWPAGRTPSLSGVVLVYDSAGQIQRQQNLYQPLVEFLAQSSGHDMKLVLASDRTAFRAELTAGADFIFCPDGLALDLDNEKYSSLAVGRRAAPRNLRPSSVLVYRKETGRADEPWLAKPSRTVVGDSLSLPATARVLAGKLPAQLDCRFGPDPYDHGPVLQAARLGAFDYAVVRQWDADRFFQAGLLSSEEWGLETLCPPVPDIVIMASRQLSSQVLLDVGQGLSSLGRDQQATTPVAANLVRGLVDLRLAGFNLLVDPDFERVRGLFVSHWQGGVQ